MDITNTFRVLMAFLISSALIIRTYFLCMVDVLLGLQKIKFQFTPLASELRRNSSWVSCPTMGFCHQRALDLTRGLHRDVVYLC
jgi:hypothetical protein